MNVPTITMDREAARDKLRAFRRDTHKDAEEAYRAAELAYGELAEGAVLLNLQDAIVAGGYFESGLPKLAICRADKREVCFQWEWRDERARFYGAPERFTRRSPSLRIEITMPKNRPNGLDSNYFALVPMVPADVRPAVGQLRDWFVLWEVERWFTRSQTRRAPFDPILLRHIAGNLYAVLAQWDLTDVERAVMEGALRTES